MQGKVFQIYHFGIGYVVTLVEVLGKVSEWMDHNILCVR
jgi:hypothetical protein